MDFLAHIFVLGVIFVAIDALWIAGVANKFYKSQLGSLLADKPKFGPAVLFYLIYLWGMVFFVLGPALELKSWSYLLQHAALLGLVMYATYDLTNLSTLKKWPVKVTVVDMLWGTFVTTVVSAAGFAIFNR